VFQRMRGHRTSETAAALMLYLALSQCQHKDAEWHDAGSSELDYFWLLARAFGYNVSQMPAATATVLDPDFL
jgi:hypothetical protein